MKEVSKTRKALLGGLVLLLALTVTDPTAQVLTFNSPVNLSNNAGASGKPHMAISGDSVYMVWHDNSASN